VIDKRAALAALFAGKVAHVAANNAMGSYPVQLERILSLPALIGDVTMWADTQWTGGGAGSLCMDRMAST
jgi:hypothetical protein